MKFKNIHSLEDIHKAKLRLNREIRGIEKSFSEKTDLGNIFLKAKEGPGSFFSADKRNPEMLSYLLPLGIKHILKLIKNKKNRKLIKRVLIYSVTGSILAFSVYQFIWKRKDETEE